MSDGPDETSQLMELNILYQDEWLVAVDKPAGQLVHPADDPKPEDVVTMKLLRDQLGRQVHPIHRLDCPTSGVLLFTFDGGVTKKLRRAFDRQEVEKVYWAVVNGQPAEDEWVSREGLRKTEDAPLREAVTRFRVIRRLGEKLALVEARPETGRFHQIRRHLLGAGHPIVGDYRYGGVAFCDAQGEELGSGTRMLLQAKELRFVHPMLGEELVIEAPVDEVIGMVVEGMG